MSDTSKNQCDNLDQRIREGERGEDFFEAVAHCLGEEVRRFAASRCGDVGGDVDDISQDAMVAAQRYLGSFRGDASLRTWLYRLVLSACSRRRRGRKNDPNLHRPVEHAEQLPLGEEQGTPDPEVELMMAERLKALEGAIAQLRTHDRELLAAVEWEGLSLAEAGERQGLTVSAVKSRMFRIRQQLRERVQATFEQGQLP